MKLICYNKCVDHIICLNLNQSHKTFERLIFVALKYFAFGNYLCDFPSLLFNLKLLSSFPKINNFQRNVEKNEYHTLQKGE